MLQWLFKSSRTILQQEGINVNALDKYGYNILHRACQEGKEEIVQVIIDIIGTQSPDKLKAYINTPTESGVTPLAMAAANGNSQLVKLFTSTRRC